jgi:tetratricopeptide (TPR) repeat protein
MERLGSEAERYLRVVVSGLPIWVRSELQAELRDHLQDGIRRRVEAGADPSVAEAAGLEALGPADELRRELQRVHRRRPVLGWLADAWAAGLSRLRLGPLTWMTASVRFSRDYHLGRYDAIIVRGEHELRARGPRYHLHDELGLAYNAIRDYDRALYHLQAEVAWLKAHPLPRLLGPTMALSCTYSNLAGVLESLGRREECEAAVRQGLAIDPTMPMLHLQMSRLVAARGDGSGALHHLEAVFASPQMPRGFDKAILMFAQDPSFSGVRDDPQFRRLLLRAAAS